MNTLPRTLGLRDLIFLTIGSVIGSGIFLVPAAVEQLLTYVVFIGWIFYGMAAASVFVYRKRQPELLRLYRVLGYPLTPILFIVAAVALVLNTIITQPTRAAVGLGVVMLGAPAYLIWNAKRSTYKRMELEEEAG